MYVYNILTGVFLSECFFSDTKTQMPCEPDPSGFTV